MDEIVHVMVEAKPTEDLGRVKRAAENIFGSLKFDVKPKGLGKVLKARTESVNILTDLLRRERIRNAARRVLFGGLRENGIVFYLNKEAAYIGHVSFSETMVDPPLGSIKVTILCENPRELIERIAPKTTLQR